MSGFLDTLIGVICLILMFGVFLYTIAVFNFLFIVPRHIKEDNEEDVENEGQGK